MRPFRLFWPLALSLPVLAQAGVSSGLQLTEAGPSGYTALGAQLILAPHPYNVIRLRFDQSMAGQSASDSEFRYSKLAISTVAMDYVHYRNGWDKSGFFIGCGLSQSHWSYDRVNGAYGYKDSASDSSGGAQFLIGGQFNPHIALEGRVQVLATASEYPLPFLAAALSFQF